MNVEIEYESCGFVEQHSKEFPCEEIINKVVSAALDYEKCPYEAEVQVLITDNRSICSVNKEHRGIDSPTDVLSFPMIDFRRPGDFSHLEDGGFEYFHPGTGELLLGDIVISLEKVMEQAEAYGHTPTRELAFLTAHSMLHLFGYDHMEKEEAEIMEEKQEAILASLGITR